ncbi:hypothetical protein R6Q59_006544 [Mikania micrantha]
MDEESQLFFVVNPSMKDWKNRFFWVSAKLLPFDPVNHDPKELGYKTRLHDSTINLDHYKLLIANKTHMRAFSEEMLVLGGLSRYWDKPDRMPTFTRRGSESSHPLHDGEDDVLSGHKKIVYDGGEYMSILPEGGPIRCELPKVDVDETPDIVLRGRKRKGKV